MQCFKQSNTVKMENKTVFKQIPVGLYFRWDKWKVMISSLCLAYWNMSSTLEKGLH